jgi:hypothetical protein
MRSRATKLGALLRVDGAPGQGTCVELVIAAPAYVEATPPTISPRNQIVPSSRQ